MHKVIDVMHRQDFSKGYHTICKAVWHQPLTAQQIDSAEAIEPILSKHDKKSNPIINTALSTIYVEDGIVTFELKGAFCSLEQSSVLRSISCGRWMGRIHRIPAWRSTSVGRWRGKPRWILRSIQSISSLVGR